MPLGCALHRAIDPEWWWWRQEHELAAVTLELLYAANVQAGEKPFRVRRPGDGAAELTPAADVHAFFQR